MHLYTCTHQHTLHTYTTHAHINTHYTHIPHMHTSTHTHTTHDSTKARVLLQNPLWCCVLCGKVSFLQGHHFVCWRLELCNMEGGGLCGYHKPLPLPKGLNLLTPYLEQCTDEIIQLFYRTDGWDLVPNQTRCVSSYLAADALYTHTHTHNICIHAHTCTHT